MTDKTTDPPSALVVEDDELVAEMLRFLLDRQGFRVQLAHDGREGQALIQTMPPPAIALLDVMLPFVDGFQLVTQLRGQPAWSEVPVIMLTAKSQERDIVRALDAGASDYIVKPFQPNELVARVRRLARNAH
jgi:DNA-binding response OmpR family regulator